jgi:predicted ester cyclase
MSVEENKAIFRRMIEEVWNKRNLDAADELFAPDATSPSAPQLPPGPEGVKMIAGMFLQAFPDLQITIDKLVASGDRVAGRLIERATHQGDFMGIAPTGKAVEFTEMGLLRIENGKIAESWYEVDMMGLMQQIGAIPAPGG